MTGQAAYTRSRLPTARLYSGMLTKWFETELIFQEVINKCVLFIKFEEISPGDSKDI